MPDTGAPTGQGPAAEPGRVSEQGRVADVLVVIVSWNSGPWLDDCLQALNAQTCRPRQTLIWDNGSDGPTMAVLDHLPQRFADLQIHRSGRNHGFAAGNNLAVAAAPGARFVLTLNADVVLQPDCLQRMIDCFDHDPRLAAVGAVQLQPDGVTIDGLGDTLHLSGIGWRQAYGQPWRFSERGANRTLPAFSPCAAVALYRRDAFDAVGGFDADFFCYFEDVDLGYRLRLAGWHCAVAAAARATHVGSVSTGPDSDFAVYHGHRNLVWCFAQNTPAALLWLALPLHLAMTAWTLAVYAARGRLGVLLRAKRDALRGLPRAWRKRRAIQALRRAGTAQIWAALRMGLRR